MVICKNCGVELEDEMSACPLCQQPVAGDDTAPLGHSFLQQSLQHPQRMNKRQKKFTWEIISLILFSGIIATFIINFIIDKRITWSEYPVAASLVIFSYVSLFAFWHRRIILQVIGGFVVSGIFLLLLDMLTQGIDWSVRLGIPILFAGNLITVALLPIFKASRFKGINLIAWSFLGAALLCISIDGILSYYQTGSIQTEWSIIVAGCIIPVVLVLLFAHFRLKKGQSLEKTFHI